jgi:hypothetical protein
MVRTAVAGRDLALAALESGLKPVYSAHEHALCASRAILAETDALLGRATAPPPRGINACPIELGVGRF